MVVLMNIEAIQARTRRGREGRVRGMAAAVLLAVSILSAAPVEAQSPPRQALVLEPFATQVSPDGEAGATEAAILQAAGFSVTVLRGGQVTVPVMMSLANYSVIYIETHSALLPDGDAVIATGETDNHPYSDLFGNGGLLQTVVAGDPHHDLYNAVTGRFFSLHLGTFQPGSILFMNGCGALSAPLLWQDLHARGLSSLIGWNGDVPEGAATTVGTSVISALGNGNTVADAVQSGTSQYGSELNSLGFHYDGNGKDTLADALIAVEPASPLTVSPVPRPFAPHIPRWPHLSKLFSP